MTDLPLLSDGESAASSSIWNIKSPVDGLAFNMGLDVGLTTSFDTLALCLRTDGEAFDFSFPEARDRTSYDSTWLRRDCKAIASMRRRLSDSTELIISGYFSKTYASVLRPREMG